VAHPWLNLPDGVKLTKGLLSTNWIQGRYQEAWCFEEVSWVLAKDKPIPAKKLAAAVKKPGKLGQRARLAQTLKGFKK
jgi:hypothetical protein